MRKGIILEKIRQTLSNIDIDLGYVIGSFLDTPDFNDVDVAILPHRELTPYEVFRFSMHVARKLEQSIEPRLEFDVKILNACPTSFQYEVINKGKLVYCRDEIIRVRYEKGVIGDFLDYASTSQWLDEQFLIEA
jgi:predicted nucleotidyltransferase